MIFAAVSSSHCWKQTGNEPAKDPGYATVRGAELLHVRSGAALRRAMLKIS